MNSAFPIVSFLCGMVVRLFETIDEKDKRVVYLEYELQELRRKASCFELANRNLRQKAEAYGDDNRYYFKEKFGCWPSEKEALKYYVDNGGAEGFAKRLAENRPKRGIALI